MGNKPQLEVCRLGQLILGGVDRVALNQHNQQELIRIG